MAVELPQSHKTQTGMCTRTRPLSHVLLIDVWQLSEGLTVIMNHHRLPERCVYTSKFLPYNILLHLFNVWARMINNKLSCWQHLTSYTNLLYVHLQWSQTHRAIFTCPEALGITNWMDPLAEWNNFHISHTVNNLWGKGLKVICEGISQNLWKVVSSC